MHQDESSYFWRARKVLKTHQSTDEAFVSLVAGVSTLHEEELIVDNAHIANIKEELQQLSPEDSDPNTSAPYFANEKEAFLDVLVKEATQIQTQASVGAKRGLEQPLFEGGLIPSADGFRWNEAATT